MSAADIAEPTPFVGACNENKVGSFAKKRDEKSNVKMVGPRH